MSRAYVYDSVTNLLIETWTGTGTGDSSSTTETQYSYTAQGQLQAVSVIRQDGATVTSSPTTTYTYDADGNVTKIAFPNGTETDYDYSQMWNASGGIEAVSNWRGGTNGTLLSRFVYTFNTQRQKVESVETVLNVGEASSTDTTINWTYDSDGRLTDEVSTDGVIADTYHDHYDYDAAGNRIDEYIALGSTGNSYAQDNFYFYNADGQLTIEADNQPAGPRYQFDPNDHQHQQYLYDANGSLIETDTVTPGGGSTTTTPLTTYGYDARNRLISTTNVSGGVTTHYGYNDGGDRVSQTAGSSFADYVVDDNNPTGYSQVVETWTGGGTPAITYEVGLAIISQTVSGTGVGSGTQYLMVDGHGSTRQLTSYTSNSSNGTVVAREDYDGFGNAIALSGVSTVILYTGQMWDAGLGQYDLRARYYDPAFGRFTSYDSYNASPEDIGDLNKYLYAGCNPVMYVDPSGHDLTELLTTIGIGAGIGALTGGAAGFAYATAYKHLPIFSLATLEDTLIGAGGGAAIGAVLGGGAYIAATAGTEGGLALLRSGATQLLTKLAGVHSTTAGFAIGGFAVGVVTGLVHPDPDLIAEGAAAVFGVGGADVVTRGLMRDRDLLIKVFGASGYLAARSILFKYVQSTTFVALATAVGFTAGYTVGYEIRVHVVDNL